MANIDSKKNLIIVFAAAAAAAAAFFINTTQDPKPGLYEYVRKAERYIEEKKFDKGIFYLEKAYSEAPESKAIREELAGGYLEYARYLNLSGRIDDALDKATAAYEAAPESMVVINDLAYYLSARGVDRAFSGEFHSASADIGMSRKLAESSGMVKTNIANYLFNRAVDARDRNDKEVLLLCLKASYALRPRFETLVFLGVTFYDMRDLEKAVFYWEKALKIKPEDKIVRSNIEKAGKEAMMSGKERVLKMPDFDVVIYGDLGLDRETLEIHLIEVYGRVGRDLGYYPPPGTSIIIYDETDFRDIFQKEGIIRGLYDGNIRIALSVDPEEIFATGVLAHEYTHAVVSAVTENNCPVWLHEGIAVYQQSKYSDVRLRAVNEYIKSGKKLSLSGIDNTFAAPSSPGALALAYEGSYTAVLFILDEWGMPGLRDVLQGVKEEGHFVNAFDEKFYISVPEFEKRWNDFVVAKLLVDDRSE